MASSSSSWREVSSSSWKEPGASGLTPSSGKLVVYSDSEEEEEDEQAPRNWHLVFEGAFSHATIEAAIHACGRDPSDEEVLDFMLASQYATPPQEPAAVTESIDSAFVVANGNNHNVQNSESSEELRAMGFTSAQVAAAIESCGAEASLETKLAFIFTHASENMNGSETEEDPVELLQRLGYPTNLAKKAITRCDTTDIDVLVDWMDAHGREETDPPQDDDFEIVDYEELVQSDKKAGGSSGKKKRRISTYPKAFMTHDEPLMSESRATMTGFSLPNGPITVPRVLTYEQQRLPYFYFENVRAMPRGEWDKITASLYGIKPEFVCASHFSVSRRPRGYVHNLPLENRVRMLPVPAQTIREFLPKSVQFTPIWDTREKLHTIHTACGSTFSTKIHERLSSGAELVGSELKYIYTTVKKWNLVWVGPDSCAALDPHEMETALGFEKDHTRTFSHSERYRALGNTFQTDVVGYHLSALKPLFPDGIRVLSLFAGIGGAEVALHRAGIPIKFLVSVESNKTSQKIISRWWTRTEQTGEHVIVDDVRELDRSKLQSLTRQGGGPFDLVIGGSPCNNLSGCNRATRTGLNGDKSSLFFEFPRILEELRTL